MKLEIGKHYKNSIGEYLGEYLGVYNHLGMHKVEVFFIHPSLSTKHWYTLDGNIVINDKSYDGRRLIPFTYPFKHIFTKVPNPIIPINPMYKYNLLENGST